MRTVLQKHMHTRSHKHALTRQKSCLVRLSINTHAMGTATRLTLAHTSTTAAVAEATAKEMLPVDCGGGVGGDDYGSGGGSGNDSSCGDLLLPR